MSVGRRVAAAVILGALLALGALAAGARHAGAARASASSPSGAGGRACSVFGQGCATGCAVPVADARPAAAATAPCAQIASRGPCILPVAAAASHLGAAGCQPPLAQRLRRGGVVPAVPRTR